MLPLTMASQGEPMTIKKIAELPLEKIWQIRLWFKAMFQH